MNKTILAIILTASFAIAAEGQPTPRPHMPPHHPGAHWDVDGDKALTKEEWLARASARFDMLDTNKDGKVTREEAEIGFKAFIEKRKEIREERKETREERKVHQDGLGK